VRRLLAVATNTYRESIRERVLYNLVFFAILMTLSGLLLGRLSIRQDEKILKDVGLAAVELFGTLIAIFVGVGLVGKEVERRSLYPLLAKPLDRREFVLGKFLGLSLTLLLNTALMTLGLFATLFATRRSFDPGLLKAVYPIYLELLLAVALALLFSTVATSAAFAAVCTVCAVIVGRFSDVIHNMAEVIPDAPQPVVSFLYYALPNFANFDLKSRVVYGDPVPAADLLWLTGYAAAYAGLALALSVLAFERKELK
jgi:ABC-type transport system involved in multi-copper enzyme maturation permease subunit